MKKELDISNLVEEPDLETYTRKPVENYGMNLLKNMGFDPNKGIGKSKANQLPGIVELKPRPKGLGLGAESLEEPKTEQYEIGDRVQIVGEIHKGMTGYINGKGEEKIYFVELFPSKSVVKVNVDELKKLSKKEMENLHREFSENKQEKKKKRLKWILPQIRVKVIDKNSEYYLKKVIITEVITEKDFECRDENGKIVNGLNENDVQTVVPKIGTEVLIVKGKLKGAKAVLKDRKKSKGTVTVETCDEFELVKLEEDDICEFVEI